MKLKEHVYEYDTVVVGGTFEAVLYSFLNNLPLFYSKLKPPFEFDFFVPELDLSAFGIENETKKLIGLGVDKCIGARKKHLFERILFVLSLAGQVPLSGKANLINIENELLNIITHGNRMVRVCADNIIIFDDENINGLPVPTPAQKIYKVYDWINVRSGTVHRYDLLQTDEDFVRELFFYPSARIDGNHDKKDAVAVSIMNEQQLEDIDYSDVYVRFKALDMMKEAGIKGRRNGRDVNNPDRIIYRAIKIETAEREIVQTSKNKYKDQDNLFFNYQTEEEIIKQYDLIENYAHKLNHFLFL